MDLGYFPQTTWSWAGVTQCVCDKHAKLACAWLCFGRSASDSPSFSLDDYFHYLRFILYIWQGLIWTLNRPMCKCDFESFAVFAYVCIASLIDPAPNFCLPRLSPVRDSPTQFSSAYLVHTLTFHSRTPTLAACSFFSARTEVPKANGVTKRKDEPLLAKIPQTRKEFGLNSTGCGLRNSRPCYMMLDLYGSQLWIPQNLPLLNIAQFVYYSLLPARSEFINHKLENMLRWNGSSL